MPGNYTSLEVVRVARKWGCRTEDRAGGHTSIHPPDCDEYVVVRDVGRPSRGFTSPKVLKRLALLCGSPDIDAFMLGPSKRERQTLDSNHGKLPAMANFGTPSTSQPAIWEPPKIKAPNQNMKGTTMSEITITDPAKLPHSGARGSRMDTAYQLLIAAQTSNPGKRFTVNQLLDLARMHDVDLKLPDSGISTPRGRLAKMLNDANRNPSWGIIRLSDGPFDKTSGRRNPTLWGYAGPGRLSFDDIEKVTFANQNRGQVKPVIPPASEPLEPEVKYTRTYGWQAMVAASSAWEAVGTDKDGNPLLRSPGGAIYRAVEL